MLEGSNRQGLERLARLQAIQNTWDKQTMLLSLSAQLTKPGA